MAARKITVPELQGLLASRHGAQFVSFLAETDARLKKTDNPFGNVRKVSDVNAVVNWNYSKAVNRQRVREAIAAEQPEEAVEEFKARPRAWGERLKGMPFVQYKGNVYLECKIQKRTEVYQDEKLNVLTDEQVAPFLRERKSNAEHQGVDNEIVLRDFDLASIWQITVGGETYIIDRTTAAVPLPAQSCPS